MKSLKNLSISLLALIPFIYSNHAMAKDVSEAFFITEKNPQLIRLLKQRPELTIDHMSEKGFELYGPKNTETFLKTNNVQYYKAHLAHQFYRDQYPTPEEIEQSLKDVAAQFPKLSSLYSIGKSTKKRDLWVMKLTSDTRSSDLKPKFKYVANMHGDEIVGRELMVLFIKDLLQNYGKDQRITQLLDTTEIHVMPSMNPDGAQIGRRGNGNNVDLNRDFPDFTTADNRDVLSNRQPETKAVMNWQNQYKFKLSANFHGGAEVVNYPWDTSAAKIPQFDLVKDISLEYANNAPYMGSSTVFENGITNGFEWYEVNGGMQDWSIYWRNDLQVTIELSDEKWPNYSTISYYYQQNRNALIKYVERIHTF